MTSKMECLNLIPFCSENLAQDSPKTLQDDPKTPQDGPRTLPDFPKTPQDAPKTPPRRPQDAVKSTRNRSKRLPEASRRRLGSVWEASCSPEAPKSCPELLQKPRFGRISARFLVDLGSICWHFYCIRTHSRLSPRSAQELPIPDRSAAPSRKASSI